MKILKAPIRIMIVDDYVELAEMLQLALEVDGHDVITTNSAEETLRLQPSFSAHVYIDFCVNVVRAKMSL
jgi:DNA-binding response OmpR family regulator